MHAISAKTERHL